MVLKIESELDKPYIPQMGDIIKSTTSKGDYYYICVLGNEVISLETGIAFLWEHIKRNTKCEYYGRFKNV